MCLYYQEKNTNFKRKKKATYIIEDIALCAAFSFFFSVDDDEGSILISK
jgi:hypothetical protein